mmetsp:Transcript_13636/g.43637  ORF Transcript_13636/g.43637 Transcript_13636/m.43637 type:complete len:201 (+) Transcript_13636:1013-1615(+)
MLRLETAPVERGVHRGEQGREEGWRPVLQRRERPEDVCHRSCAEICRLLCQCVDEPHKANIAQHGIASGAPLFVDGREAMQRRRDVDRVERWLVLGNEDEHALDAGAASKLPIQLDAPARCTCCALRLGIRRIATSRRVDAAHSSQSGDCRCLLRSLSVEHRASLRHSSRLLILRRENARGPRGATVRYKVWCHKESGSR